MLEQETLSYWNVLDIGYPLLQSQPSVFYPTARACLPSLTVLLTLPSCQKGYFLLIPGRQWRVFLNNHKLPLHGVDTSFPM